ncbi:MAG: aminotransferase class I/II-fold pyridoxal phosphate-dependent enzyme [Anaerolineales bacterium]|nr:aminotransferase class I/II-fold pyridoxal phosphate-dependent enzyme [Anaerolineales bacterium]MDW8277422.1 aminotransferase class I/II-fold pyridoxal phosphate-dependent enzyme [Anaerolineales bacterium]
MNFQNGDSVSRRLAVMNERVKYLRENNLYFYNQPVQELRGGSKVIVNGREMGMYASYSYLGLIGHPRINAAAQAAIEKYGTGTHGVRMLAGTLSIHRELEETIADFKRAEAAITYSSGYATNLTVIATLMGRGDYVLSDKLNHASIVDGCLMSGAEFRRFRHNDMDDLEKRLQQVPDGAAKLVVADAVFSMDGDVIDLPRMVELCRKYGAYLMIDEAHSVGVLGKTGRGIEEYFDLWGSVDIKMGTLSKTIPSVGGYVAGKRELIEFLRHASRAYIFSAALPPAQAAAANEAFKVILDEPWRIEKLTYNANLFINGLKAMGFDTMQTTTAIVPVLCGTDERAFALTRACQENDVFVLPVVSPAVPEGLARLRATVLASHEEDEIRRAMGVIEQAGKALGLIC